MDPNFLMSLSSPSDSGVISVEAALYGRADSEICTEGQAQEQLANTDCAQDGTLDVLKRRYTLHNITASSS